MASRVDEIRANLDRVRERIARAAARAGRHAEEVTLVAVAKTFPAEAVRAAFEAGVRHFGENRVQEWEEKQPKLEDLDATWHLVGHLQSNKARRAAALFHHIDSVGSIVIANRLDTARAEDRMSAKLQRGAASSAPTTHVGKLGVLIEVRLATEETKGGVEEKDLLRLAEAVLEMPHLELRGLMCIPPFFEDPEKVRPFFSRLRELQDELSGRLGRALPALSMGMSHDFEVAIEEGATQVRLGTAVFGAR